MDFPNVTILIGRSPEGLEGFAVGYFEVAFVDGQHTYTQVAKDLEVCHRLLTPGSMVFCHDYDCNDTPEVKPAVDDCIATGAYKEVGRIDRLITLERL